MDSSYSACVLVNGVRLCRTRPSSPVTKNYLFFDSSFFLEFIPTGSCHLQLQLCYHGSCKNWQSPVKEYFELSSVYPIDEFGRELAVSQKCEGFCFCVTRYNIVILPEEQYASFVALLQSNSFLLCRWTASVLDSFHRSYFARLLLFVYLPDRFLLYSLVDIILDEQLDNESESTLFRGDSFCSCLISTALRIIGRGMAFEELSPLLDKILSDKTGVIDVVDGDVLVAALVDLLPRLPPLFSGILSRVARTCKLKFSQSRNIARRALSTFFVLRFVNPMLAFWNMNGCSARSLAKIIQNLANTASSADLNTDLCSKTVNSMVYILDSLAVAPQESAFETDFFSYNKADFLALLAFEVESALKRYNSCPISEASTVSMLLKRNTQYYSS